jgi:hypothetical protein
MELTLHNLIARSEQPLKLTLVNTCSPGSAPCPQYTVPFQTWVQSSVKKVRWFFPAYPPIQPPKWTYPGSSVLLRQNLADKLTSTTVTRHTRWTNGRNGTISAFRKLVQHTLVLAIMSPESAVESEPYLGLTIDKEDVGNSPPNSERKDEKDDKNATSAASDNAVPDGGLRAWLVVIGVCTPSIFCWCSASTDTSPRLCAIMLLREPQIGHSYKPARYSLHLCLVLDWSTPGV